MTRLETPPDLDRLDFAKGGGSVTVVVQDAATRAVLMVAGADREALAQTIESGEMHFRSRARGLWHKGATSGNVQRVVSLHADCDGDAVLALVAPAGPACHTGETSCFASAPAARDPLRALDAVVAQRVSARADAASYTQRLLGDSNLRLKKLGEECAELIVACASGDRARAASEAADLLYHMVVALRALDVGLDAVEAELAARSTLPRRAESR